MCLGYFLIERILVIDRVAVFPCHAWALEYAVACRYTPDRGKVAKHVLAGG
jgi:hypothetical protein